MLTADEILSFLKQKKVFLKKEYHCTEIALFGSFARNEQNDESDIDFLVVFEPGTADLWKVEHDLKDYLMKEFNRPVDICSKKWIKPVFIPLVLNEAIYA